MRCNSIGFVACSILVLKFENHRFIVCITIEVIVERRARLPRQAAKSGVRRGPKLSDLRQKERRFEVSSCTGMSLLG
jgi:hypothetical protein